MDEETLSGENAGDVSGEISGLSEEIFYYRGNAGGGQRMDGYEGFLRGDEDSEKTSAVI